MRRIVIYNRYDIVKVPFPFTDRQSNKNRPALIISSEKSFNSRVGHSVMAMITSAKHSAWPLDTLINDLDSAGLPVASLIRLKLFTLDHRLIIKTLGHLSDQDRIIFNQNINALISDSG
jgi:mRNA-degrading endonuclease toxin of MazEF toxin-antitoxin module